ncbi:MAG: type II secretion system major pseudopilin GspG [bacterium]|nr:type II secretion system major pseudopilin GspG [Candidatus Sumerlaeota bacterium]
MTMHRWLGRHSKRNQAFTFIEIMLVVLIIGILMAVVAPRMVGRTKGARIIAAKQQIRNIGTALYVYELKAGKFPTTQEGLQALLTKPSGLTDDDWDGPYMKEIPKDPWGEECIYRSPGDVDKDFDLVSKGPDKQENTEDDITNFSKSAPASGGAN